MQCLTDLTFFACSSRWNIEEPTLYITIILLFAVSQVRLPTFQIATTMLSAESLNDSSLKFMISSKNEHVIICDLIDHTLKITFDAWWTSINVGSKRPSTWNNARHVPSWRLYWHCGIDDLGIVIATVSFSDRFYYSGCKKPRTSQFGSGFWQSVPSMKSTNID